MPPLGTPLSNLHVNFNTAGVAGLLGAKEAVAAMATIHLYKGRRWLGWFNSPASYSVAKRFGRVANSRFWRGIFPGQRESPAVLLGLDDKQGPQYIASLSGAMFTTQHLGYLTMQRSKKVEAKEIEGRVTLPMHVTYLAMKEVDYALPVEPLPLANSAVYAFIPIAFSLITCVLCALVYDWFSFSTILIGIVSNGFASLVIGKGELVIESLRKEVPGVPPGHGILMDEEGIVVIKGAERDVNVITKGRFDIKMGSLQKGNVPDHHDIGLCSIMLFVQSLVQLFFISQGTLWGQIMFILSVGPSWVYNSYLASLEKDKIQADLLFQRLGNPQMLRFRVGTRTTMAVFVCLLLFHEDEYSSKAARSLRTRQMLRMILPNETRVWMRLREKVVDQLMNMNDSESESLPDLENDEDDPAIAISGSERKLLKYLLEDARAAFREYFRVRDKLPADSSRRESRPGDK